MTADRFTTARALEVERYIAFAGAPLGAEPQNPLVVVHGHAMVRKDVADAAIRALEDMLVETTNELRRGNHMYAELTDKYTEALMRAEKEEG